jgi:hypothetical protein
MDIFDKIANDYLTKKSALTQPLRLRRDYGEEELLKEARMTKEKFAERLENDPEFAEKWEANKFKKKEAGESEIDRIASEFISEREAYAKGPKGSKDFKAYHKSNKEFAEIWDGQIEANKDKIKPKKKKTESKPKSKSTDISALGMLGKKADESEIDRIASEFISERVSFAKGEEGRKQLEEKKKNDPEFAKKWDENIVHSKEEMDEKMGKNASDIFDRIASEFISERVAFAKGEEGRKQLEEKKKNDPEFAKKWDENTVHSKEEMDEKMGRSAGHHEHHRGSYMSVQHLNEMQDLIAGISEMIHHGEELPDWVESKIAHTHQTLLDLVGYFQYGEGFHSHE